MNAQGYRRTIDRRKLKKFQSPIRTLTSIRCERIGWRKLTKHFDIHCFTHLSRVFPCLPMSLCRLTFYHQLRRITSENEPTVERKRLETLQSETIRSYLAFASKGSKRVKSHTYNKISPCFARQIHSPHTQTAVHRLVELASWIPVCKIKRRSTESFKKAHLS